MKMIELITILISKDLQSFGIPSNLKGCEYLRTLIRMAMNIEKLSMERLYSDVAEAYSTTPSAVERAVRHAIGIAWNRGNSNLHSIFQKKPVSSKLISYIAKDIQERLRPYR